MDKMCGNCFVMFIVGSDFDVYFFDVIIVRIWMVKEFFYFDKIQYVYEGVVSMFIVLFKLNCYIGKILLFFGLFIICLYIKIVYILFYFYNMFYIE